MLTWLATKTERPSSATMTRVRSRRWVDRWKTWSTRRTMTPAPGASCTITSWAAWWKPMLAISSRESVCVCCMPPLPRNGVHNAAGVEGGCQKQGRLGIFSARKTSSDDQPVPIRGEKDLRSFDPDAVSRPVLCNQLWQKKSMWPPTFHPLNHHGTPLQIFKTETW